MKMLKTKCPDCGQNKGKWVMKHTHTNGYRYMTYKCVECGATWALPIHPQAVAKAKKRSLT
jgi:DNA-directed RNA polymerase subunit M/transcription elongation factor TFIIS